MYCLFFLVLVAFRQSWSFLRQSCALESVHFPLITPQEPMRSGVQLLCTVPLFIGFLSEGLAQRWSKRGSQDTAVNTCLHIMHTSCVALQKELIHV